MKKLFFVLLLIVPMQLFAQTEQKVEIKKHFMTTGENFTSFLGDSVVVSLDGVDSVATDWLPIKYYNYFAVHVWVRNDTSSYGVALGGNALDLDLRYTLSPNGDVKSASREYIDKSTDVKKLIMNIATADTVDFSNNYGFYESLNGTSDFAISPAQYIKFWIILEDQIEGASLVLFFVKQS